MINTTRIRLTTTSVPKYLTLPLFSLVNVEMLFWVATEPSLSINVIAWMFNI